MTAVLGATGQLGAAFARVLGSGARLVDRSELDLTAVDSIEPVLSGLDVGMVINCAGYTAVDDAESNAGEAMVVNAVAVGELARACASLGKRFVTFSSDYVFDGTKDEPYVESDIPNPQNVYGTTKLEGERMALSANPEALVVRTSWVMSGTHSNFVATMLRLISAGPVSVVDDQIGHPTIADDLAAAVLELVDSGATGLLHRANQGIVSWFQLALECAEIAGLDASRIAASRTEDFPRAALRPSNSVLESERIPEVGRLPHYREGLEAAIAQLLAG